IADARCSTLVDVTEQTRPAELGMPPKHRVRAGASREDPQQQVERLPDGPRVHVRAEVPYTLLPRAPVDMQPRELFVHRDGQSGIRFVVAVADIEPRVELFDPVVFEL